ncbi:MAG TPA: D-alanyl-D-alanine carboxypeptidase/D-alanyl-D-alanine-endopeptidase [Solirubrobacterales bacterium]|nr:D-alanyl-D-alanine carboxypeptidase/D-alanyl-D-alanine-endopeptidase [Solirubrobacterales bacterium]
MLALLMPVAGAGARAPSCAAMKAWLGQGGSAGGLLVVDAETGEVACRKVASRRRSLASNMKLFTTSTALARLGPDARIATKVMSDGALDENGVLRGSLYLQGGGDPALGTPAFYERFRGGLGTNLFSLKSQIRSAGIEAVTGRVYADDTLFDRLRGVADSGFGVSPYIGPLSGLAFNSGYSGPGGRSFASDPAKTAAATLARALRAAGVRVPARPALRATPARARRVAVVRSPTVSQLADATNVPSNNFYAETLVKLLGARFGSGGSTAAGAAVVAGFARGLGSGVHAVDGSGLTRSNRASPAQVVALLRAMRASEAGDDFIQSLALTGREGTVASRMDGTAAEGRCRTKTGTLTGVSALSGYCFNRSGRVMAFSILMNGVSNLSQAHDGQDRIAAAVASY